MSRIRKMKLIPFEKDNDSEIIKKTVVFETNPNLKKTSMIESEIENILNSNLSEREKFENFLELFRIFLKFKDKLAKEDFIKINDDEQTKTVTPIDFSTPAINETSISTDATLVPPSPRIMVTPKPKNRSRLKKLSAKRKIKNLFENQSDSDESDHSLWLPYKPVKNIKTIRRLKSK